MRIVQAVFGVFHHFELARELHRRGHLAMLYSTWPWVRLEREGLPRDKVETFPWLHVPELLASRARLDGTWLTDELGYRNALAFDRWTDGRMVPCDALIAISGAALTTGRRLQERGGIFICDRGSTHQRYQERILREEYGLWGVSRQVSDERDTIREEAIYEQADKITVPSQVAARSFAAMGVPAEKVEIIPYGVRLESFYRTLAPSAERFDLLFAGSVSLRKGVPYLLQAFAAFRHPRKRLRIAGQVASEMKTVLGHLPQDQVEFLGSVSQNRLRDLMSESQALVLPSIEEGFSLVIAQAMACCCPVICTAETGGDEIIENGRNGWVVPLRSPKAITQCLDHLAGDPELRSRLGEECLKSVQCIGGWRTYGDRWEALLQELTGQA